MGYPEDWDDCSPGIESWWIWQELMQRLSGRRGKIEAPVSEDTETQ